MRKSRSDLLFRLPGWVITLTLILLLLQVADQCRRKSCWSGESVRTIKMKSRKSRLNLLFRRTGKYEKYEWSYTGQKIFIWLLFDVGIQVEFNCTICAKSRNSMFAAFQNVCHHILGFYYIDSMRLHISLLLTRTLYLALFSRYSTSELWLLTLTY